MLCSQFRGSLCIHKYSQLPRFHPLVLEISKIVYFSMYKYFSVPSALRHYSSSLDFLIMIIFEIIFNIVLLIIWTKQVIFMNKKRIFDFNIVTLFSKYTFIH